MGEKRLLNGWADELRPVFSTRMVLVAWIPCLLITILHYRTLVEYAWAHDVLRRLYYLPILFAAFSGGVRGGISVSVFASFIYFPHAFLSLVARDPGDALEKGLEILLYNIVAVVAGLLVDRERREREKQERLARKLSEALEELQRSRQALSALDRYVVALGTCLECYSRHFPDVRDEGGSVVSAEEAIQRAAALAEAMILEDRSGGGRRLRPCATKGDAGRAGSSRPAADGSVAVGLGA